MIRDTRAIKAVKEEKTFFVKCGRMLSSGGKMGWLAFEPFLIFLKWIVGKFKTI